MKAKIRKLKKQDFDRGFLESLSNLFKVGITSKQALAIYKKIYKNPVYRFFIAEVNGDVVGAITLLIEQKFLLKGAKFGYLEDLAVRREFEGRGIGKYLIESAVREAKKEKCRVVRLDCNNHVAILYESSGFHRKPHVNRMQIDLAPDL